MELSKIDPNRSIKGLNNVTVEDFWVWAYSDILNNRNRSILAEFIVGHVLEVVHSPRIEWNYIDLVYCGKTIEVKSASYIQSWEQKSPSKIVFDIEKKLKWDPITNICNKVIDRNADCYVFCLYAEKNPQNTDILNIDSWKFWVISTDMINSEFENQKSVSLSRISEKHESVGIKDLRKKIDAVLNIN